MEHKPRSQRCLSPRQVSSGKVKKCTRVLHQRTIWIPVSINGTNTALIIIGSPIHHNQGGTYGNKGRLSKFDVQT